MEKHKLQIVNEILKTNNTFTYDYLADILNVSNKTIRNYINDVERFLNEYDLQLDRQVGVGINLIGNETNKNNAYLACQKKLGSSNYYSLMVRQNVIIGYLLANHRKISISYLEKLFYITRPSIYHDIEKVKEFFDKYDIKLKKDRKRGIYLDGGEKRYRNCLTGYSTKMSNLDLVEYKSFPLICDNVNYIFDNKQNHNRNIVGRYLDKLNEYANIEYSNQAKELIITNLLVSFRRIHNDHLVTINPGVKQKISNPKILEFIIKHHDYFQSIYGIKIPTAEAIYIATKFSSSNSLVQKQQYYINPEIATFCSSYIDSIKSELNINNYDYLVLGITKSIKTLLAKKNFEFDYLNPHTELIKKMYPDYFELAKRINPLLLKKFDTILPDDEIATLTTILAAEKQLNIKKLNIYYCNKSNEYLYELNRSLLINNVPYISKITDNPNSSYDLAICHDVIETNKPLIIIPDLIDKDYLDLFTKQIYSIYCEVNNL
jgi:transcriptional antiterminator